VQATAAQMRVMFVATAVGMRVGMATATGMKIITPAPKIVAAQIVATAGVIGMRTPTRAPRTAAQPVVIIGVITVKIAIRVLKTVDHVAAMAHVTAIVVAPISITAATVMISASMLAIAAQMFAPPAELDATDV